jgi:hypothetical protein
MIKEIMMKRLILAVATICGLLTLAAPGAVYAAGLNTVAQTAAPTASKTAVCDGLSQVNGGTGNSCDPNGATTNIGGIVRSGLNIFSIVIGIAAVVMIMVGGFRYITSGGDSASVASAKNTILYALVGLVVAGLAQIIVQFVVKKIPS